MTAAVVASPRSDGRTRCTTLRSDPPITLRETPDGLYLVASGAGPVGGDALSIDVDVARGASLVVRSSAASMVLPGPTGAQSSLTVTARVAGALTWTPEPTVLVAACNHRATVRIELDSHATLEWREMVVLGRHGESGGSLLQRLRVDRNGRPLLRTDLTLGPAWPGSDGPGGTGGADVTCSTVIVGRSAPATPEGDRAAVLQLAVDAWLVTEQRTRHAVRHSASDERKPERIEPVLAHRP